MDRRNLFENYEVPQVEVIEMQTEQVFASSGVLEDGDLGSGIM